MKNVIFDMDGVIFDSEHVCERCWEDYKEKYKLKDAKGMFHACIGTTIEKTKETMFRFEGPDFPYEEFRKDTSNRFHEIEETEGLPVKRGARELLSWLKESGANVGLASSTRSDTVIRQLTHAGLIQYFDVISLHAAGLHPIMVPDLLEPNEEMQSLAEIILPDLLEVRDYLKNVWNNR